MPKRGSKRHEPCRVTITPSAAEQLRSIQKEHSSDPSHVMRIEAESQGFSLWLGPEVAGDVALGSEGTYQLRVSPEQAEHMAGENLVVDYWAECPNGARLIIYREEEPPAHLRYPQGRSVRVASERGKKDRAACQRGKQRRSGKDHPGGVEKGLVPGRRAPGQARRPK